MAYAEVTDIERRWRDLSTEEQTRAEALIDDASAMLDALCESVDADIARIVVSDMVIRAMSATQADSFGASSMSMTAGPYSQSWSYSNPSGDLYLTKLEKRMLGITASYIGSISPKIGATDD